MDNKDKELNGRGKEKGNADMSMEGQKKRTLDGQREHRRKEKEGGGDGYRI